MFPQINNEFVLKQLKTRDCIFNSQDVNSTIKNIYNIILSTV